MTTDEFLYLRSLKRLDDIHLGMRAPSMLVKHPEATQSRCINLGWARFEDDSAGGFVTLTTKGLRVFQRETRPEAR